MSVLAIPSCPAACACSLVIADVGLRNPASVIGNLPLGLSQEVSWAQWSDLVVAIMADAGVGVGLGQEHFSPANRSMLLAKLNKLAEGDLSWCHVTGWRSSVDVAAIFDGVVDGGK